MVAASVGGVLWGVFAKYKLLLHQLLCDGRMRLFSRACSVLNGARVASLDVGVGTFGLAYQQQQALSGLPFAARAHRHL